MDQRQLNSIAKKAKRVKSTLKVFSAFHGDISDEKLAEELSKQGIVSSRSTVARDLGENLMETMLYDNYLKSDEKDIDNVRLTPEQEKILEGIRKIRTDNLAKAKSKGGRAFAENNISIKDSNGKFKGSKKRV